MKLFSLKFYYSVVLVLALAAWQNTAHAAFAQLLSVDGCCATYLLTFNSGGDAWVFLPDETDPGTSYSGTADGGTLEITHCFDGPGTYRWYFDQNGNGNSGLVQIVNCEGPCCEVDIRNIRHITNPFDPCQVIIFFDTFVNGPVDCLDGAVTTYDYGDGTSGTSSSHTYSGPGPWEVCITITKGDCVYKECAFIETPGCEDPCCEVEIRNISYLTSPFNPCQILISHDTYVNGSEECLAGAVTTYDYGDGTSGTSSFHTYPGPGPWTICITITKDDCKYTGCRTITLPECSGNAPRAAGVEDEFGEAIQIFPNPVVDYVNLSINQDVAHPPTFLRILSTTGDAVHQQRLFGERTLSIDLATIAAGLYIVQLSNEDGIISSERLVKLK